MSKIAISGASTGSATFTIESPATSTNRTITIADATGTMVVSGTTPSLNGITFPATQVASADANTLDDYEEGNWSPVLLSNGGGTVSLGTGNYVKIGKMVLVGIDAFNVSLSGLSAGDLFILGFPFTQSGPAVSVSYFNIAGALSATQGAALAYLISNTTAILYKSESTSFGLANVTISDLNANISIRFNGYYTV